MGTRGKISPKSVNFLKNRFISKLKRAKAPFGRSVINQLSLHNYG